jgi:Flp pilus assembly pilin Flp
VLSLAEIYLRSLRARLGRSGRGQSLVEYGLALTMIVVIVIAAVQLFGPIVSRMVQNAVENVNAATH